ncbi:NAD(P)/FAD-dependent oxidoreductase [Kocuria oceani]|uniref:NAD(P)/FAD-dependent oxidoreductase n=1 Tax=Kocuria oceani TaxID=988827 RepID=UPI004035F8BA
MNSELPAVVDVLVVGGGVAGLSAATWLGRYQRSTLVVDAGQHRNRFTDHTHGLLGRDPISPQTLLSQARAGLEQYPQVTLHAGTVTGVTGGEDGRFLAVVDGTQIIAQRIVLATGVRDQFPQIAGFEDHYGTGVYHCPACDGLVARGQTVIVLGGGEHVPAYASEMLDWAATVRIVTDTTDPVFDEAQRRSLGEHGIEIVDGVADALIGDPGALEGVRLCDGGLVEGTTVFFSYAHHPTNSLAADLGCELDAEGHIIVNEHQLTSVEGVYAAGDITPGLQLVPIAIGQGVAAGVACATSLRGHDTTDHAPAPAPPTHQFTTD